MWLAPVVAAVVVALSRGQETAAAAYAAVLTVDVAAGLTLGRRTAVWWGMGRGGARRIGALWGAVAVCHWSVGIAFYLGPDETGAFLVLVAGVPSFLTAGTALAHLRYMNLIADTLGQGERLLAICTGRGGPSQRYAVLAATDRRVVGFAQTSRVQARLEQFDSIERSRIVDVSLEPGRDYARVAARTADRELGVTHAGPTMAEAFVEAVNAPPPA